MNPSKSVVAKRACFMALFVLTSSAAFPQTQRDNLVGAWKYSGLEEFDVFTPADSFHRNDAIQFVADGKYTMVKDGKKTSGSWTLNSKGGQLVFSDVASGTSLRYTLKSLTKQELVIEFQTPDLVRTKYFYKPVSGQ